MNYFVNDKKEIFAYDDEQIKQGLGKNLKSITEVEALGKKTDRDKKQSIEVEKYTLSQYLKDTDWYIIRQLETSKKIPADVAKKREIARKRLGVLK